MPSSITTESKTTALPLRPNGNAVRRRVERGDHGWRTQPAVKTRSQSALGSMLSDLNGLFRVHLGHRATRSGEVGQKTRRERRVVLEAALRDLLNSGYELRKLKNLGIKHIERILGLWRERELQASTLATYISHLRTLCRWLEKPQLVEWIDRQIAAEPTLTRRRTATDRDRSEQAAGVDLEKLFDEAIRLDRRFACILGLIVAFGLRSLEAWLFRPHLAEGPNGEVNVFWGTKGGRPRTLPMPMNSEQRAILEAAKTFVESKAESMIPRGWTLERWRWRYYWLCRRLGLTRSQLGITPHSLRHGVLLDLYEKLTGVAAPARGGALVLEDRSADRAGREVVANYAGHDRVTAASAYLGSVNRGSSCAAQNDVTTPESLSMSETDVGIGTDVENSDVETDTRAAAGETDAGVGTE